VRHVARTVPLSLAEGSQLGMFGLVALALVIGLAAIFRHTLAALANVWSTQPEYSLGYMIPFVALFLLYQRLNRVAALPVEGAWSGPVMVLAGLGLAGLGQVSTMDTVAQYGFLLVIWGLALAYLGWRGTRALLMPLAILVFMVPIPNYLLRELTQALQLLSSRLGVELIRWCAIAVYLEGNVIDLGVMKLQVVEACSGLRYLFSLLILSFLVAHFFHDRLWKRVVVFLSAIPITIALNSARIALVGLTVDRWGQEMAEGVLHNFEGVTIFVCGVLVLLAEVWLLTKVGAGKRKLRDALTIALPQLDWPRLRQLARMPGKPGWAAVGLVTLAAIIMVAAPKRSHASADRPQFADFPLQLAQWTGRPDQLDPEILAALSLSDYLLVNYWTKQGSAVNLYAAYYASQAEGNSAHSPRACIPADGWEILSFQTQSLERITFDSRPLRVNRVVIQKADNRALVYYWFQQRGRVVTDEYMVKLYIFEDALSRDRSDGAMVRLVTAIERGEDILQADARLQDFASVAVPQLRLFIPV